MPPAIFVMGPTATGKSALAMALAERLPCEIVSVDSAMVYQGMDIGTAKPSAGERAAVRHRLIDVVPPDARYSAARFRSDALREMDAIARAGRVPLLVGGTMLYFQALERGLSTLPSADAEVRARLERQAGEQGWAALHARLARIDPRAARRIHPHDPQRVQRALEVYELTGTPMTELAQHARAAPLPYRVIKVGLIPAQRACLYARIAQRFDAMLAGGLLNELRSLRHRYALSPSLPSMRAVGYRQAWDYLEGRLEHADMVAAAVTATRHLAKRQLTWLRGVGDLLRVQAEQAEAGALAARLRHYLD